MRANRWLLLPLFACLAFLSVRIWHGLNFVDAHVYLRAFADYAAGANPYHPTTALNFVYPPVFLYAGSWLISVFSLPVVKTVYAVAHIAAALVIPWILYRYYLKASKYSLTVFYLVYVLAPGLSFLLSLDTGNLAVIAFAVMLGAGAIGIRTEKWSYFYCAVFFCATIKITYLPLLLIPLLCSATSQLVPALLCAALVGLGLKAQGWLNAELLGEFWQALHYQTIVLGDVGTGMFGIVFHALAKAHVHSIVIPVCVYAAAALACVGIATLLRLKCGGSPVNSWPAVVLCVAIVAIPRIEYYDLCYACPLMLFVYAEKLRARTFILLYLAAALPALYFRLRMPFTAFDGGYQALAAVLLLIAFLGQLLLQKTNERPVARESLQRLA